MQIVPFGSFIQVDFLKFESVSGFMWFHFAYFRQFLQFNEVDFCTFDLRGPKTNR